MAISPAQKSAIEEIVNILISKTDKKKRSLSSMFMELVNRDDWPQYYELIPEPRCFNQIRQNIQKNKYKNIMDAYTDLSLVFWNAMFYNEPGSRIAEDAKILKGILESEWKKRSNVLPASRSSPPPTSPQKVHAIVSEEYAPKRSKKSPSPPAKPATTTSNTTAPAASTSSQPQPQASTSKPVTILPRQNTPDVDVEMDSGGESDTGAAAAAGGVNGFERDPESEDIVRQLERSLPRWPGYTDEGWMMEVLPEQLIEIVHAIKSHKDVIGNRLATALESVPEESSVVPNLSYTHPLSLKIIETRARSKSFESSKEFDMEMTRLFEKARKYHEPGREHYARVLLLQRLYQALTSGTPPFPGPPYTSQTNFASVRAGPGSPNLSVDGITMTRVSSKDRTFVDTLSYKGWTLRLADWVHLSNPDDPGKPIVGQIFRCWVSGESWSAKKDQQQPGMTVVWYYRPEQTYHTSDRLFWENEVFKTSHFADHPLPDLIEKITCQFTARHIRGRPRPPYYHPGFPLYVCDSRYNDRDRIFVKIKNWRSCVPEEVRGKAKARGAETDEKRIMGDPDDWMPIFPFERTVYPRKLRSPFIGRGGTKGPGGLVEGSLKDVAKESAAASGGAGAGAGAGDGKVRKGSKRTGAIGGPGIFDPGADNGDGFVGTGVGASGLTGPGTTGHANVIGGASAVGGGMGMGGHPGVGLGATAGSMPYASTMPFNPKAMKDRSIVAAAGGFVSSVEKLPAEIARHFDRDPETGEVLWFAAPPMNVARPPEVRHSLDYLHFVAMKRKRTMEGSGSANEKDEFGGAVDSVERELKRSATASEMKERLWKEMRMDEVLGRVEEEVRGTGTGTAVGS